MPLVDNKNRDQDRDGFITDDGTVADLDITELLSAIFNELKIMNFHLSMLTDTYIKCDDLDDSDQ